MATTIATIKQLTNQTNNHLRKRCSHSSNKRTINTSAIITGTKPTNKKESAIVISVRSNFDGSVINIRSYFNGNVRI